MKFERQNMYINDYLWWLMCNDLEETLLNYKRYMNEVRGVEI